LAKIKPEADEKNLETKQIIELINSSFSVLSLIFKRLNEKYNKLID